MRTNVLVLATLCLLAVTVAAQPHEVQTSDSFTGKWEGTFKIQGPGGKEGKPVPILFNLTQKGEELTGKAGLPNSGGEPAIEKGVVANGKATFQIDVGVGLNKFSLTVVDGRLRGEMTGEREGMGGYRATVDAAPVK